MNFRDDEPASRAIQCKAEIPRVGLTLTGLLVYEESVRTGGNIRHAAFKSKLCFPCAFDPVVFLACNVHGFLPRASSERHVVCFLGRPAESRVVSRTTYFRPLPLSLDSLSTKRNFRSRT